MKLVKYVFAAVLAASLHSKAFAVQETAEVKATVFLAKGVLRADISFPAADVSRELYLAAADVDAGVRTNDWPVVVKFADIPAGVTSLTRRQLPAVVADKQVLRFFVEKKCTSADYVQNGLVFQLDGIDNAIVGGQRTHDDAATKWTDLVGGLTLTIVDGIVAESSVRLNSSHSVEGLPFSEWTEPATLEVACKANETAPSTVSAKSQGVVSLANRTTFAFDERYQNTGNFYVTYLHDVTDSSVIHEYKVVGNKRKIDGMKEFHTYASVSEIGFGKAFVDGVNYDLKDDLRWSPTLTEKPTGRLNVGSVYYQPSFSAIRLYAHLLTDEEVAHNAAVDAARFLGVTYFSPSDPVIGAGTIAATFNGRQVVLTAAALAHDRRVIAVWGDEDGGKDVSAWAKARVLGVLAAGTPESTFDLPKEFCVAPVKRLLVSTLHNSFSYIKRGLVLQYDGLDNVLEDGVPRYDATASVWADLSGNGYDVAFPAWVQVEERGVLSLAGSDKTVPVMNFAAVDASTDMTIEYVMDLRRWTAEKSNASQSVFSTPLGYMFFRYHSDQLKKVQGLATFRPYVKDGTMQTKLGLWYPSDMDETALHTYAVSMTTNDALRAAKPVVAIDGVLVPSDEGTDDNWVSARSSGCAFFGNKTADIGVSAIRVYNRQLTEDELAANAAIDEARFFGRDRPPAYESTPAFGNLTRPGLMLILR